MKDAVTLALLGDVMLGRLVNEEISRQRPEWFWGDVLPLLQASDGAIANLECAITRHQQAWQRTPKVFHFRADPEAIEVLRVANICCVSLANNHTLDFEEQGLLDTLHHLDEAGIAHAGAGRNRQQAQTPTIVDIAGLKVGLIALTDNEPPFAAQKERPGTNYVEIRAHRQLQRQIQQWVKQLRQAGAQLIILSAHLGPNMVVSPSQRLRNFAHGAIANGVDLFYGHSAHVFQAVERRDRALILHDTGDFLDDYAVDEQLRNDWSFLFLVDVNNRGLQQLRMLPVRLSFAQVNLAANEEFSAMCQRMRALCSEFGLPLVDTPQGLTVPLASD